MSKKISSFILSLALVFCAFFGLTACKGPLDNLSVELSSKNIQQTEEGYSTTLTLGTDNASFNITAKVDGAGKDVSKQVNWKCSDFNKVSVTNIKYNKTSGENTATITGLNVTQQGYPVKITVSSIEKTSADVVLLVDVIAEATKFSVRNNSGIAVKGSKYIPNVEDYFEFYNDEDSTNVTIPNYSYELTATLTDNTTKVLAENEIIPLNAKSLSIKFVPSKDNVFDTQLYTTQVLEVPASQVVLYEPLESANFSLKLDDGDNDLSNDLTINTLDLVLNQGNGMGQKFYIDGVNKDIMKVSYAVNPASFASFIDIQQDVNDAGVFYFSGQDETGANEVFIDFFVSYIDPTITSKGLFKLPFRVVSYPNTITINSNSEQTEYSLTVYDYYAQGGENLSIALSPYSSLFRNMTISLNEEDYASADLDNLQWYVDNSTTPINITKDKPLTILSGTRLILKNGLGADGQYGNGTLHFTVTIDGTSAGTFGLGDISRTLTISMAHGIKELEISNSSTTLNADDQVFYLSLDNTDTVVSRDITLCVYPTQASAESLQNRFSVSPANIVNVEFKNTENNLISFSVTPLKVGTATITFSTPTGKSLSVDVRVFAKFSEYSLDLRGQSDLVGKVVYKQTQSTEEEEVVEIIDGEEVASTVTKTVLVDEKDSAGNRILELVKIATNSTIDFTNVLTPSNAYIKQVRYTTSNNGSVRKMENTSSNYTTAQLYTGNMYGSSVINCIVSYYEVDENTGQVLTQNKIYSFNVSTYNKPNELILSNNNITLYAISSNSTAYIYNQEWSSKDISISVNASGPSDVVLDDAEWRILTKPANIDAITIKSNIIKQDAEPGVVYGGNVTISARASDGSVDKLVTTVQVTLKHYNTTLSAILTVTVSSFTSVKNASFDVTNLNNFTVTQNQQTGNNDKKVVSLYTESNLANDAYFTLRPTVTPVRATNKNLEYLAFDYSGDSLQNKEAGLMYNACNLVSVNLGDDGYYKIVVNKTQQDGVWVPNVGRAKIFVLAQDKLTKRVETITDPSDISPNAIVMSFEVVVSDGEAEAYRIYTAQDFLKIYEQKDKNFVVMTDISGVDISSLITSNDGSFVLDTNFGGNLSSFDSDVVRTISFAEINVVQDASQNKIINGKRVAQESGISIFNVLSGNVSNLNIVLPKYTYTSNTLTSLIDLNLGAFAQVVTGVINNVNFNIDELVVDISANNHNDATTIVKLGAVAQNAQDGAIQNFVVFMPDAKISVYNYAYISAGVALNYGVINSLTTSGNIILNGNNSASNVNFGGVVGLNRRNAEQQDGNNVYYVKDLESTINLNSHITLDNVGGVVAQNKGGVYDARYMVIDDGTNASALFGLNLTSVQNAGGVVGSNEGRIEYGYAVSFVQNSGISINTASYVGGVVGFTDTTLSIEYIKNVHSSLSILSSTDIALDKIGGITGNKTGEGKNRAQDFYSNSTYTYNDATTPLGAMTQTTPSVWSSNTIYTNGFYEDNKYYFLLKDGEAYLPDVPSSLSTSTQYLVMEYVGKNNENNNVYNHTPVIINNWDDAWASGTITQITDTLGAFTLFGDNGLFVLSYPPVKSLDKLRVKVTSSNTNVVQVLRGVFADEYKAQIMGNGTAVLTITSVLNTEAKTEVQVCVINGFASFSLSSADNSTAYDEETNTLNLKKGYAQQFSVNLYDVNQNSVSAGSTQADFVLADYVTGTLTTTKQIDSFVINSSTTNTQYININKIIKASFFKDTQNLNSIEQKNITTEINTYTINTTTGPTAVRLNQNGVDIYAGGYVNTKVEIDCDDEFINDTLYIWRDGKIYAKIVKQNTAEGVKTTLYYATATQIINDGEVSYTYEYSTDLKDTNGNIIRDIVIEVVYQNYNNGVQTFELEYHLAYPQDITQTTEYDIDFEARPSTAQEKGDVLSSYVLHIEPQGITALDMYHYTDVIEDVETGNLTQAGKIPSNTIVAGGYGLLKVTIDPSYVDFSKVEITSSVVNGVSVGFNQRKYNKTEDVYTNYNGANIEVLNNGIITYKNGFKNDFEGTLYFRTYIPQSVSANASFTITINVYDANNNILKTASKLYTIYAASALTISYDNSRITQGDEPNAYIAKGTGGVQAGDVYKQNANIVSVKIEAGLIDPTFNVVNYNGSGAKPELVEVEEDKNIKLKTSNTDITKRYYIVTNDANVGDTFAIELSAKTYISGILQTIKRTMTFKVVDIVINYKWNTPTESEVLKLALNGDSAKGIDAIGGAISNVYNNNWVFTYSEQPIQITQFVSDLRGNRGLLSVDTTGDVTANAIINQLRNIPEFSFDITDATVVAKVINYLKYINQVKVGDTNYIATFMYKDGNGYAGITQTTTFNNIQFMVGQGTEDVKNYYIKAQSVDANPQLKSNFYVKYENGEFAINTESGILYNFEFGLTYEENTSKDHPLPIRNLADLLKMEAGKDYILLADIDLNPITNENPNGTPFSPINTAISSFDGNNYALKIHGNTPFNIDNTSNILGVFGTVGENTILKNVTIQLDENTSINCITQGSSGQSYTIGLLAGVNNGAITNSKVISDNKTLTLLSNSANNSIINFGGLVGSNQGYITNSKVENTNFNTTYAVFGGLVSTNSNIISASYVNNVTITNTAESTQTPNLTAVAGFVANNNGTVVESYVGGLNTEENINEENAKDPTKRTVSITSNSDFAAFIYNNPGSITDSYANVKLDNATTTVVSGFVFANSGNILRAYTASVPSNNQNTYSRPFVGTTFNTATNKETINNTGTITNSYYYSGVYNDYQQGFTIVEEDGKQIKLAIGMTAEVMSTPSLSNKWNGFAFASTKDSATGVWNPISATTLGPTLINPNILGLAEGVHQTISKVETVSGNSALYHYTLDKQSAKYNSKDSVALIYDAQTFNQMFDSTNGLSASNKDYYARIIKPIDLSSLTANNINLTTTTSILRGTIMGNNMTISGVDISYFDTSVNASNTGSFKEVATQEKQETTPSTTDVSIGLFGEIRGGTVASVSVNLQGVYAETQARLFVGGLAGRVVDGTIYNINLTGTNATVLGRHLVGGVAGGVFGKSRISNINAGVSVTSAFVDADTAYIYNHDIMRLNEIESGVVIKNLSISGGLFGVIDLFDYNYATSKINYNLKISETDTTKFISNNLNFTGNGTIVGQTVGGVAGVVGCNTILTNATTTILNNTHLRASVYAGGLVGQNNGTITYSKVEYDANTQNSVNIANTGAIIDTANNTVFNAISYTAAVGGLVGANFGQNYANYGQTGVIRYANSSIYVDAPNAQNVGGLVGIVFGGDIRAVYATGYVLGVATGSVGGLIGTVAEITFVDNQNIMPTTKIAESLLIKVNNPYNHNDITLYPQTILLDFVVAQNNWASNYYNYYQNLQLYGYLGGLVGFATEQSLLTTSHNSENYKQQGYAENETVVINYYNNIITRNPVAVNANITESSGLKLDAFNIYINPVKEDNSLKTQEEMSAELTQKTAYLGQGDTRNVAFDITKWDWFSLWDSYSIVGRNGDNTPILKQGFVDTEQKIYDTTDFLKVYWHPDGDYTLQNDIYFTKQIVQDEQIVEKQIKYIMVGTSNLPFSGKFDGRGYTIYGLSVSNYLGNIGGLFGCVAGKEIITDNGVSVKNAEIKDLTIDGASVNNLSYIRDANNKITNRIVNNKFTQSIGGLAGFAQNVDITNVVLQNLKLDAVIQNTNTNTNRYVGGLVGFASGVNIINSGVVGVNADRTAQEIEQNEYNGIHIVQQNALGNNTDTLFVGGLVGFANVVKINKDVAALMTSSNVDVVIEDVNSNTYFGAGIGWAENVDANVLILGGENIISGTLSLNTKFVAGGYYGVLSGNDETNPNTLYTGYAYSTIRSTLSGDISNIKLAYDFNLEENLKDYAPDEEKPTTTINLEVASIISNIKTFSQAELLTKFNADVNNEDKIIDTKRRSYNATSIISTGIQAALKVATYSISEGGSFTEGEGDSAQTVNVQLVRNIPLDPYYSLAIEDDNYNTTFDDLKLAPIVYGEILDFTKPINIDGNSTYGNSFGYIPGTTAKITQQLNLLNNVFGKISKLYYIDKSGIKYGAAVVLSNGVVNTTSGVYYILTRDVRLNAQQGQDYVLDNLSGIFNGHNHTIVLTDAVTLANEVSGILTGVKVQVLKNNFNNKTLSGNFGIIANTVSEGGVINASGSYAVESTTSTAQDVEMLELTLGANAVYGGVVGYNNGGVINNCWSHIAYNIKTNTYSAFGGIVGKSNGGVLSNLNYYGDSVIGDVAKVGDIATTTGGILGVAESNTDMYMVLSYIFAYSGTYHITNNQNITLYTKTINNGTTTEIKDTAIYFNFAPNADGGLGMPIDFASVFKNIDINDTQNYHKSFVQYWGIWDKEEDCVNYGLPRLKVEPQIASKGGRNEDDAIEVPNETIFAGMLQYEKAQAGRFYILTKEEQNGEYYLQEIYNIMNSFYGSGEYSTVNQDSNYYGHLIGNNKKLVWRLGENPKPIFNVFANAGTLYSGTNVIPYIKELTIENRANNIANIIANENESTLSYIKYFASGAAITITNPSGYYGGLVGQSKGRIENCMISGVNFNVEGTNNGAYIGGIAGKITGTAPISNTSLLNCQITFDNNFNLNDADIYVGGVVGYNDATIQSTTTSYTDVDNSSFMYFVKDTYIYYYTAAQTVKYDATTLTGTTENVLKAEIKEYAAGTYLRFKNEAQILILGGGEYQEYIILNKVQAHFNTAYNGFKVTDAALTEVSGSANTTLSTREDFVITEGSYQTYPYLNANLFDTGGLVLLTEGAKVNCDGTVWEYDANDATQNYRLIVAGDSQFNNWVLTEGFVVAYKPTKITQSADNVRLKNTTTSNVTFYYAYKDNGNYIVKRVVRSPDGYLSTGLDTGHQTIWLVVIEGVLSNRSASAHNLGAEYYPANSIRVMTETSEAYYVGDNSQKTFSNIVDVDINTQNKLDYVGGVTGYNAGTIVNTYFVGNINGKQYVGGVAGFNKGSITNAIVDNAQINAMQYVGGIAGQNGGTINNAQVKNAKITATDPSSYAGGIAGSNQNEPYAQAQITNGIVQNVRIKGFEYTAGITGYNNAQILVNGSQQLSINDTHIQLTSAQGQDPINRNVVLGFVTTYNEGKIDFTGASSSAKIVNGVINFIQDDSWNGYTGDYTINLGGLAGINNGVIIAPSFTSSTLIFNPTLKSSGTNTINFGGLAGYNNLGASIRNIKSIRQNITTDFDDVDLYIAGIAAQNQGYISGNANSSYIASTINSKTAKQMGGVVATNSLDGVIYNAYFNGTLAPLSYLNANDETVVNNIDYVGGIAGQNYGVIMSSRFNGSITANDYVGGIAGLNASGALIASVTVGGDIDANNYVGGIIGKNDGSLTGAQQTTISSTETTSSFKLQQGDQLIFDNANIDITNSGGINNPVINSTKLNNASYTITSEIGSKFTAFITRGTTQTISGGTVNIKVLTQGASWNINGSQFANTSTTANDDNTITANNNTTIIFNTDALLQYVTVDNNVKITYSGGDVYIKENAYTALNASAGTIDGYVKISGDGTWLKVNSGSFTTTSNTPVTVVSNTTTATLAGVATYGADSVVYISNNAQQMYLRDTTSVISGQVVHNANTTVEMGVPASAGSDAIFAAETLPSGAQIEYAAGTVLNITIPRKAPEQVGNDYYQEGLVGGQTVYMKYSPKDSPDEQGGYEGVGYFKADKTTQVYPKYDGSWKWYTDAEFQNRDNTLNGRFNYAPQDNFTINVTGDVKFANTNFTYDTPLGVYKYQTKNQSFVNPNLAENATERDVDILLTPTFGSFVSIDSTGEATLNGTINPKYTQMASLYCVETVDETNGSYSYTQVDTHTDPEYMLNLTIYCVTNTTITYNQNTAVSVQGTQTYKTQTTSTYNNTMVKHFGLTPIGLNGADSAVTEQFITNNAQVSYPVSNNLAVVTMPNNQAFSFAGQQGFANKTILNVTGTITVFASASDETGTTTTYNEETEITVEAGKALKSGDMLASYNGAVNANTTIITEAGTIITYNSDSTVEYDKDTKSTITGTVVYPIGGFVPVTYEANSAVTYQKNAQLILGANTTIHPQSGFKFKLTNANSDNKIRITIGTYDWGNSVTGTINYVLDDGNNTSGTVSTYYEFECPATITVNNNNTLLTFNNDANITIDSAVSYNQITYTAQSNITYYQQTEVTYNNTTVTQPSVYASGDNANTPITYTFKSGATQTYSGICYPTIVGEVEITNGTIVKDSAQFSYLGEVVDTQDNGLKNNTSNSLTIHGNNFVGGAVGLLTPTGTMQNVALQDVVIHTKGGNFVGGVVGSAVGTAVHENTYNDTEDKVKDEYSTENGYSSPYNHYIFKLNIVSCSVQNVFIDHPSADTDGNQYGSYVGGFAGDLSACYVYDSGVKNGLYINAGYTIGGFAGSIGGGGNQGWYTFALFDTQTVGGNNQDKDVIFSSCYLMDVCNYNNTDEQAQLFSNTDNPNGNFLTAWTGYEGGVSVWNAVGSSYRQVFGGSQTADERNLSAIIGQNAVKGSYYIKNRSEIKTSGKGVNVNEPR